MSDDRFSSGGPNPCSAPSDYFAPPVPPPNPYGAPGQPANPFGPPPPGPQAPFGAPVYGQVPTQPAPPTRPSSSKAKPIVVALVVAALTVAGWIGYRVYEHSRPINLPSSLGGLLVSTLPSIRSAVDQAQAQLRQRNPGMAVQFQAYGSDATRILFAGAARGRTNVDDDLTAFGNNIGASSQVGGSTCAVSVSERITVCERSEGDLTVLVGSFTTPRAADEQTVAALVDEVRSQI